MSVRVATCTCMMLHKMSAWHLGTYKYIEGGRGVCVCVTEEGGVCVCVTEEGGVCVCVTEEGGVCV